MDNNPFTDPELWHPGDNLLDGLTFEDLIIAACCNLKDIDDDTLRTQYHSLLNSRVHDSWEMYRCHLPRIKKEIASRREDYNG